MSAPSLGPGMNQSQPTPAPLQTGTPGTPVDAGQVQVTILDGSFHPEQPSNAGPSQCINVQVTAKSNGSNANARQYWLTSSAHQGVRAYEDDDGVEHNVQWRVP